MGKGSSTVVIRPEKSQDYAGIHEVNRLAFRRESEARLIENLRDSPGFMSELSFVAIGGKNVAGHVLFFPISIETADGDLPVVAMSPLAVRPELKKEGIDERLMHQGIKECRRLGYKCIVVMGALSDYRQFGFSTARWSGLRPSIRPPGVELLVLEFMPGLIDSIKGTVKIPPAFVELWETGTF